MTGNIVIIEGDTEAKFYLESAEERWDNELRRIANDVAEHAAEMLRYHAPDRVAPLIDVDQDQPGNIRFAEATAGVLPDPAEFGSDRGLGSDPADWPVFVDVGTGVFGPTGQPIRPVPGHWMAWPANSADPGPNARAGGDGGFIIFAKQVRGQPGKHFSDEAFRDTVEWVPARLAAVKLPLE